MSPHVLYGMPHSALFPRPPLALSTCTPRLHHCDNVEVGKFVFFSSDTSTDVLGGTVRRIDVDAQGITVHGHRQANITVRWFSPLYTNTTNSRIEQRAKPLSHHTAVLHDIPVSYVHAVGNIERHHGVKECLLNMVTTW